MRLSSNASKICYNSALHSSPYHSHLLPHVLFSSFSRQIIQFLPLRKKTPPVLNPKSDRNKFCCLNLTFFFLFLDCRLIEVLKSEQEMEKYVKDYRNTPQHINPIIWQIHFSVPARNRMGILNDIFERFLARIKMLYCFLPLDMVLGKVYRMLNVPFTNASCRKSPISNVVNLTQFRK